MTTGKFHNKCFHISIKVTRINSNYLTILFKRLINHGYTKICFHSSTYEKRDEEHIFFIQAIIPHDYDFSDDIQF